MKDPVLYLIELDTLSTLISQLCIWFNVAAIKIIICTYN